MTDLLEGKKILIADDEQDILDTLEELLPMCWVKKANDFRSAKEILENLEVDLAILDIMGVDGYNLLEITNKKKVTAVMLTAHAFSPEDTAKSYKGGAASYVPKELMSNIPIYLNDVLEAQKEKKNTWWRWKDRFSGHYDRRFGQQWKDADQEFWKLMMFYGGPQA